MESDGLDEEPRILLTVCGRQLLRHFHSGTDQGEISLTRIGEGAPPFEKEEAWRAFLDGVRDRLLRLDLDQAAASCPELASLIRLMGQEPAARSDFHLLVHSDAWLDAEAAALIGEWLIAHGQRVQVCLFSGIRQGEPIALQRGLAQFARWCGQILTRYRLHQFHIIFNPVGGSHILSTLVQTLAPFYADESAHLMEPGTELVRLAMPKVRLSGEKTFRKHLLCLRRLAGGLAITPEKLAGLPPDFLVFDEQGVGFSFMGVLLWDHNKDDYYGGGLLEPISERIILTGAFRDDAVGLKRDRLQLLNERVDQLALFLEKDDVNPAELSMRSLEFPQGESTHRCHGWVDDNQWRLLGHYEGKRFVLDRLQKSRD